MMLKHANDEMVDVAEKYIELKERKKFIEGKIKEFEAILKEGMAERGSTRALFGDADVLVKTTLPSTTVDVDRLKADGLYDKYSKLKAGYTQLVVTRVDGAAIRAESPF